jgi:hypothetical protein
MILAFLPLEDSFGAFATLFREISSSLCDSRVVDDEELVSAVTLHESFLDPNFDLQLDLPFSGKATTGTVRFLITGVGSSDIVEVIGSIRDWLNSPDIGDATESGEYGFSIAEQEPL